MYYLEGAATRRTEMHKTSQRVISCLRRAALAFIAEALPLIFFRVERDVRWVDSGRL